MKESFTFISMYRITDMWTLLATSMMSLFLSLSGLAQGLTQDLNQGVEWDQVDFYDVYKKDFYNITQLSGRQGVAILFTSLSCAYSEEYEKRFLKLKQKYISKGFRFVLVNSNDPSVGEEETIDAMRLRAVELGVTYTSDQSKIVKNHLKATKNGEVLLIVRSVKDGVPQVYYQGAFDDNPLSESQVKVNYLKKAMDDWLEGRRFVSVRDIRPVGCRIR